MEKLKGQQIWAFVIGLLAIAILVNYFAGTLQNSAARPRTLSPVQANPSNAPPLVNPSNELIQAEQIRKLKKSIANEQTAENAVERHTNNLSRYVNPGSARKSASPTVAVDVVSETGSFDSVMVGLLSSRLDPSKLTIASGLFTPEFVSDGLFASAFSGSRTAYSDLEISNAVDVLLLGRETVRYSKNETLQGLITADFQLDLSTAPVVWTGQSRGWSYAAKGAGFSHNDARAQALERITKQINADTNNFLTHWYTRP
jgi:hypothetical protein